jgi:hypothetical protein
MKKFPGSYSESSQESFVLNQLKEKKYGYYVEIGAYHPTALSNTYLLETQYNWSGVGLEINKAYSNFYNQNRANPCLAVDATTYDLKSYFIENKWPRQIDYLQLDIEPTRQTLAALLRMPMDYRYSVITFEHDRYVDVINDDNEKCQEIAYNFLKDHGYKRVVHNMRNYEDWYIDPRVIDCNFLGKDMTQDDLFNY